MGIYGPGVTEALQPYATQFDDIKVQERNPIVDLNAINPLSELRESWQNATSDETEHRLQTTADTDDIAYLTTNERGQYTAGYEAQAGMGVRVPNSPTGDSIIRWGYFTTEDGTQQPKNGWFFGEDSDGVFVAEVRAGDIEKVYQEDWNIDIADGSGDAEVNPSGFGFRRDKGNIFQVEFVYYGYGPTKMQILTDDFGKVNLHKFRHSGQTSVTNTNLPLQAQIDSVSANSDDLDLYVGGRQFSIIGQRTTSARRAGHYVDSYSGIDDTQWYPIMSVQLKDGTDIGSIDFRHVLADILSFETDTDNSSYRWQVRRGAVLDQTTWQTPSSHEDKPDETAMKVDTSATTIDQGSGATGVVVDGGTLSSGGNNETNIQGNDPSGQIAGTQVVTLVVRATPGGSGTISETYFNWQERW